MSGLVVRKAVPGDVLALIQTFGQRPYFEDRIIRQERGLGDLIVAVEAGRAVGDVYLWREESDQEPIHQNQPGVPTISHLEVVGDRQRQGIASALLDAAERLAYEHGHTFVVLGVGLTNTGARALYDGRGYDDWGKGEVDFRWVSGGVPDGERCHVLLKCVDPDVPGLLEWHPWHPREVAHRLRDCPVPWAVAGGWAIDLHLGRQTRPHEDLEIAIPRGEFARLRPFFGGLDLYGAGAGRLAKVGRQPTTRQIWVAEDDKWRLDIFLEPGDDQTWVSHRDERVRVSMADAVRRDRDGIAHLAPELVLFAKAKHTRAKDEADLAATLPTLDEAARRWLADAVALAHPGHPWVARVRG